MEMLNRPTIGMIVQVPTAGCRQGHDMDPRSDKDMDEKTYD